MIKKEKVISRLIRICYTFTFLIFVCTLMPQHVYAFDYNAWLTAEQAKYPAGKYWNHVGMATDNSEGYTDSPCTLHGASGVDHVAGTNGCTCNHFRDPDAGSSSAVYPAVWHLSASQCMGFANKLGYDMFGSTKWSRITSASDSNYAANIRVGDIVRISGHSAFVISKTTDNKITVGECNYVARSSGQGCLIAWGRAIDLTTTTIEYYERAQNYDGIVAGTIAPVVVSTEQPTTQQTTTEAQPAYTGWQETEDGRHYIYLKKGVKQTKKWITVKKKEYYVDNDGYRVTGLYKINKKLYYFNGSGVLQKNKWITNNSKNYYIGTYGYALSSQWIYKGKTLMYVKSDCAMAKSELVKIYGSTYLFNAKGKRSQGFKKLGKKYYYCNANGIIYKKQWITKGKKRYYVDKKGVRAQNKLVKIQGAKYYFNSKGVMQKNKEVEYDGKIYKADASGRCKFIDYVEEEDTEDE